MLLNGLQVQAVRDRHHHLLRVEAGAFVNPSTLEGASIQAFCVPIVYLCDRDTLDFVEETYGFTITTVEW